MNNIKHQPELKCCYNCKFGDFVYYESEGLCVEVSETGKWYDVYVTDVCDLWEQRED